MSYGRSLSQGDRLSVCLDLKRKHVRFLINDKNKGIAYHNISIGHDIEYRLVVSIYFQYGSVEIIDFDRREY